MKRLLISSLALMGLSLGAFAEEVHWGYEGDIGPEFWAELSPEFELCGSGREQSPVDISGEEEKKLARLCINYAKVPMNVINNGHTIQVNVPSGAGQLSYDGVVYELKQFHFHTPSEHTKNGRAAPMEVHFVHISDDGQIAVIGVFLKKGRASEVLDTILEFAPNAEGELLVPEQMLDISELQPGDTEEYYHYRGSLTTPPCSEGLKWFVMDDPVSVSVRQIKAFQLLFHANARPVQPLNDRTVYEADD